MIDHEELLGIYLNDHLAGAAAGIAAFRRARNAQGPSERGHALDRILREVEEDRAAVESVMRTFGFPIRRYKQAIGLLGERVSSLKLNGRLTTRSPLSDLVEFEGLLLGVLGRAAGLRTLRELAETEPRLDGEQLDRLIARAERQAATLEELRVGAVHRAFG